MTTYELLLFGHIAFVVTWVGTSIAMQVLSTRAFRGDQRQVVEFLDNVEWLGNRLQGPAALLVVLFGILLVVNGEWGFSKLWIILALVAVAISFLVAVGFLTPETKRVSRLIGERGYDDPQVKARIRRVLLVSRFELLILTAVIFDMAVKPGQ